MPIVKPSFANVHFIGKCNMHCAFCVGYDAQPTGSTLAVKIEDLPRFERFLCKCHDAGVDRLYLTGLNCDPLQYQHLPELIDYLQKERGMRVGIRTNGLLAPGKLTLLNRLKLEVGYSINTLDHAEHVYHYGTRVPRWGKILSSTRKYRASYVARAFKSDPTGVATFNGILNMLGAFHVPEHFQVRRVYRREWYDGHDADVAAFEAVASHLAERFNQTGEYYGCKTYDAHGITVCMWSPEHTSIQSLNYFTDGHDSSTYRIADAYKAATAKPRNKLLDVAY